MWWLALQTCIGIKPSLFLRHNGSESTVPLAYVVFQTKSRAWHLVTLLIILIATILN